MAVSTFEHSLLEGGRILDPTSLQEIIGDIQFDSERSKQDQDFRILIPPSKWESVKQYCLRHLENPDALNLNLHRIANWSRSLKKHLTSI